MSISQMLLSFPPLFPFSFRTSTEPGWVVHWNHWSWVLGQTPKLAYSPLTYYSPTSLSTTLTWLLLHCSVSTPASKCSISFYLKQQQQKHSFCLCHSAPEDGGCSPTSRPAPQHAVTQCSASRFTQDILQRSSRGWQCPCMAPGAAYSWHQLDPAVCTERLLLSCCA